MANRDDLNGALVGLTITYAMEVSDIAKNKYTSLHENAYAIYRGYSNFLLNMAFISPSEVENIYIS